MNCPVCQVKMARKYSYRVKGLRYNNLPGMMRVYWCYGCQAKRRFLETSVDRFAAWNQQWEEARQQWIKEQARLEQRIYWMNQPTNYAEQKLQALRSKLIHLIESTY